MEEEYDDEFHYHYGIDENVEENFAEYEDDWEEDEEEQGVALNWEKEAKEEIRIALDHEPTRKKTIYELDSYVSSGPSTTNLLKGTSEATISGIRYSTSKGLSGVVRIHLTLITQKLINCVIDENVTIEYPWIFVNKELIEDSIHNYGTNSDFFLVRKQIEEYPESKILIGYAPSVKETGQFYICVTLAGKTDVLEYIEMQRQDRQNAVQNMVYKFSGDWNNLGSHLEIDGQIIKNNRPLYEIEATAPSELLNKVVHFEDRNVVDYKDSYTELLPDRQIFNLVSFRKQMDMAIQTKMSPSMKDVQTSSELCVNECLQYQYEPGSPDLSSHTGMEAYMIQFLEQHREYMCDQVKLLDTWDLHTNDSQDLVRNERDTHPSIPLSYTEYQSYHEGKLTGKKVISDLTWHPVLTGIAIASYSDYSKSSFLAEMKNNHNTSNNNLVLVWSLDDCLAPKLILKCLREVIRITVCPFDGNVIVGACINGQIVIWDITGKIDKVETVEILTNAQLKSKLAMKNLMSWAKELADKSIVDSTAMSSLEHSQRGVITEIVWIPCYYKIDKNGRINELADDASYDDLNWQFVTACEDGTVAFWDLKYEPEKRGIKTRRKIQITIPKPLKQSISRFKSLDGIFKPDYLLTFQYPEENRNPVITSLNILGSEFSVVQCEPFPTSKDIIQRRFYKPIFQKTDYQMKPEILFGTLEGDVGCGTWGGYDFNTGSIVNRESCRWIWKKTVHDGPVTHMIRSKYLSNILLTIGGTIFAIWKNDFQEPCFMKSSKTRYTACSWGTYRPTVIILARVDGTVEIWDLIIKSHEPCSTQRISGRQITGIYPHGLPLNPQCLAFCDYNGVLRIFTAPPLLREFAASDIQWMKNFIQQQIHTRSQFSDRKKTWNMTDRLIIVGGEKQPAETQPNEKRSIDDIQTEAVQRGAKMKGDETTGRKHDFLREARLRWRTVELVRMQRVILEKKGLNKEVLEKQREPLMKLQEEITRKQRKINETLQSKDQIYDKALEFSFPEQHREGLLRSETINLPLIEEPKIQKYTAVEQIITNEPMNDLAESHQDDIEDYKQIEEEALASLENRKFHHTFFDLRQVLKEARRVSNIT